jgi:hypothetical protein
MLAPKAAANTSVQWARHSSAAVRDSGSLIRSSHGFFQYQRKLRGLSTAERAQLRLGLIVSVMKSRDQPLNWPRIAESLYYVTGGELL